MTGRELTKLAIQRKNPPRYPVYHFNKNIDKSDIINAEYGAAADFTAAVQGQTEWGYRWITHDQTMGQPVDRPIKEYEDLERYRFPDPMGSGRLDCLQQMQREHEDKFIMAGLGISGFNQVTFIRGFEDSLEDLYLQPEKLMELTDRVMSFESAMIRRFGECRADAVSFFDDWGSQNALLISPALWRQYFKPRYKKQFDLVHELGMLVYFHSCGYIKVIIPDLIEIGVDILNLNQPDIFGVKELGREFGGRVCFNCPVDHQTLAVSGTHEQVDDYIRRMKESFGQNGGGFIGHIEYYASIGMTDTQYDYIENSLHRQRKYGGES